jgi:hypothetical protein
MAEWGLDYEIVSEALAYDADTGKIWWKIKPSRNVLAGSEAGSVKATRKDKDGKEVSYRYVRLQGVVIPAQRIAWLLHYGEWPLARLAFADGDPLNLAIANLEQRETALTSEKNSADYVRKSREEHQMFWKDRDLQRSFGLSLSEYSDMVAAQGNKCGICGESETQKRDGVTKALAVDHCHETDQIRGLLCAACNVGLGAFKDNAASLRAAADYIEKHASKVVPLKAVET